jgi:hypothetical protein
MAVAGLVAPEAVVGREGGLLLQAMVKEIHWRYRAHEVCGYLQRESALACLRRIAGQDR